MLRNKYFIPDSIIILLLLISLILNKIARNLLIWTDERKKRKQTMKTQYTDYYTATSEQL